MGIWCKRLLVRLMGLVAVLAGGSVSIGCGTYGMPIPTYDPLAEITDFSYTPAKVVRIGDELRFTVTMDRATPQFPRAASVEIGTRDDPIAGVQGNYLLITLNDEGVAPDELAADGVYTGDYEVPASLPPQTGLRVSAHYGMNERGGLKLDILPEEK